MSTWFTAVRKKDEGVEEIARTTWEGREFLTLYEQFDEDAPAEDEIDMSWYSDAYTYDPDRKASWGDCLDPEPVLESLLEVRRRLTKGKKAAKQFVDGVLVDTLDQTIATCRLAIENEGRVLVMEVEG